MFFFQVLKLGFMEMMHTLGLVEKKAVDDVVRSIDCFKAFLPDERGQAPADWHSEPAADDMHHKFSGDEDEPSISELWNRPVERYMTGLDQFAGQSPNEPL